MVLVYCVTAACLGLNTEQETSATNRGRGYDPHHAAANVINNHLACAKPIKKKKKKKKNFVLGRREGGHRYYLQLPNCSGACQKLVQFFCHVTVRSWSWS